MDVAVHHRSTETAKAAEEVASSIRALGRRSLVVCADLTNPEQVASLFDAVRRDLGALDLLVNNASTFERIEWPDLDLAGLRRSLTANLEGPFLCARAAESLLRDGGAILNLADVLALEAVPAYTAHGVSKAALLHLTRCMARALAPRLRVCAIVPGTVLPPEDMSEAVLRSELRRIVTARPGRPEDVAEAVAYLFGAEFATGVVLEIDGGRSLTR